MGIHTGTPTLIGDDYTGWTSIGTAHHGCGMGWADLALRRDLSLLGRPGITCRELGWYDMKGLTRPERLYQLEGPSLASEFPRSEPGTARWIFPPI